MSSTSETSNSTDNETTDAPKIQRFSSSRNRCFKTPALIDDDEASFCVDCSTEFYGYCPTQGLLTIIKDTELSMGGHVRIHKGFMLGGGPYACTHCDKKFLSEFALSGHLEQHLGEKPFACPHCVNHFTEASVLKVMLAE